ncbi:RND family efflux transporter, MFP subunit [Desulfocapsa sulfexigens DSM 10523]|uniref:RND family efflux transporter, MFP subunit n=1 Tax=Desulfocapsa sulfexigens (strain DSM 10523 / SB164P1) TaxID=1167006 RepID=M1P381_DESSD|nr:efflux RND transporter periplasmic adaptor subunit [Desulfocapsa sulfexigens]AGF77923.1 RND family efflux transporter, MFP subunit [Desulfocapsa sulfexigens DSM 10523]
MKTFLSFLVLILAVAVSFWLYANKPQTKKSKPERPVPMVRTILVQPTNEAVVFEAAGLVIPAREVELQTEVEGRIIEQNTELVPGGIVAEGEMLIQIDPLDYRLQVSEREAELATARYELEVEEGRQIIAREEWSILEQELLGDKVSKHLALREPHLRNSHARLEAAESRLAAAKLAEKRTTIRAPFNGLILKESVETGQFVGRQTVIAALVSTDQFWVQASVPLSLLDRLQFPDGQGGKGSAAQIVLDKGYGGKPTLREGTIFKLLPDLDPKSRMARLLIEIPDPFNLDKEIQGNLGGKILLGSYVKVQLNAGEFPDVYVVPRAALREGDLLWLISAEGRLDIRPVKVLWRRIDEVLVTAEEALDEPIVVSRLVSPVTGMQIRTDAHRK